MAHQRFNIATFVALFLLVLLPFACKYAVKNKPPEQPADDKNKTEMPKPNTNLTGDYPDVWKIVDSLERQGLYKSALEQVEALQTRAQGDRNSQQVIKCLLFRGKYAAMLEEDGLIVAMQTFEKEVGTAVQPEKSILQSLLAELYAIYLQNQGWKLGDRTPVPNLEGGDILTWSADQVEHRVLQLYNASVAEETLLKNTPVESFRDITYQGVKDTVKSALRPSLYDLLAHRALAHFANERSYLNEPAYKFELEQESAFVPAERFVNTLFETKDSTSGKWLALRLFQKVIAAHAGDREPSALIDADLLRLQFVRNNSVHENKNWLYQNALEVLHKKYYDHPSDAEIVHALAVDLYSLDVPEKVDHTKRAVAECEDALRRHPNTYGAGLCRALLNDIRARSLSLETEQVYVPDKSALFSIAYRNLGRVWIKVVRGDHDPDRWQNVPWEKRLPYLNALPVAQARNWAVTDPGDYRQHRTELYLDPLPLGRYWVLASATESFNDTEGQVVSAAFSVSNLGAISFQQAGSTQFLVAHRLTGAPLSGVNLTFFRRDYNYNRTERREIGRAATDQNGLARADIPTGSYAEVRAALNRDTLWLGNASNYRDGGESERRDRVHFFTDRALYRPGQTVYFKGILYGVNDAEMPAIRPNREVTARFYDVNDQEKGRLTLRSNEFGTFNGAFTAPATGLAGNMSIRLDEADGQSNFNVEEYKRPKFEVTFKPLEGAYRLNEPVTLKGEAKAYAGSVIDGAQARYRVVRVARFPFWGGSAWWRRPWYPSTEQEIANGEVKTDVNGQFDIRFTALPDRSIPKKDQPVFDYRVSVDVTDISGETRSGEQVVSAGYAALQIDWNLSGEEEADSLHRITLKTTNMAGQFQAAEGTVTVQRLTGPPYNFIDRYWEKPDIWTLSTADYRRMFPEYAGQDADNPEKWPVAGAARSVSFNTATAKTIDLGATQPGWYLVTLNTKDAFGETVERKQLVRVWDRADPKTQFSKPAVAADKYTLEPGETTYFRMGGSAQELNVFFAPEKNGALDNPRWLRVDGAANIERRIAETDRGGVVNHWMILQNNRIHTGQVYLNVPWSNKDLNITFETFRDKLAPGQPEEWRLKISGPKKDKVAAEMVAALYDASLDQFLPHDWSGIAYPTHYARIYFGGNRIGFGLQGGDYYYRPAREETFETRRYQNFNWFGFPFYGRQYRMAKALDLQSAPMAAPAGAREDSANGAANEVVVTAIGASNKLAQTVVGGKTEESGAAKPAPPASIRRNLNETVFFFPQLRTDAEGNVILKFTMNEALTRWKLLTYAHTKDLQQALAVKEVVTQKELMVLTNAPRFLREGDEIEFSAKVSNLSQAAIAGTATLSLLDAATLKPVETEFGLAANRVVNFNVPAGQSAPLGWKIKVPEGFNGAVTWQVYANSNKARDGEESTVPVVSNRMLVTETLPISLRGKQTKTFRFDNFKNGLEAGRAGSLVTHTYSIEFSSNPAWYAVQALPYMMEYPHECSEQVFSRFYANTLASSVTQKMPNLRRIYDRWKGTDALKSNLSKNQELKYALLEETPWVLEAQNEAQQKQNIALLFDLNRMSDERARALGTLAERQLGNGGWAWFPGGQDSWYITQHIATGFGHLAKLGAFDVQNEPESAEMVSRAVAYCDTKIAEQYRKLEALVQEGKAKWEDDHLDGMVAQYLYMRSFFPDAGTGKEHKYYLEQAAKYWLGKGLYQEGMLALALHRNGRAEAAGRIVASLRERAQNKEELGMYWAFDWGYYWYQLPIETQALMVEVFDEVAKDPVAVENLRIWLLKNKQTNRWESTKATAEAVYALLLNGDNWLDNAKPVQVSLGGKTLRPNEYEPGTGYFKQQWAGKDVKGNWSEIKVENPNSNIVWGAAYWQYFEDLDKIQDFKKTPLTIVKQLFKEENSPTGPVLKPIAEGGALRRGDKLKVRIEIRVDRPMEFVHLKDLRAAGFEPVNVLSGYRWQGGLGYYESTKDLATHFFIDYLPRGTYVFEYPMFVSHKGDMSNGITTIQCMYAPEFTSHSKGVRVRVE